MGDTETGSWGSRELLGYIRREGIKTTNSPSRHLQWSCPDCYDERREIIILRDDMTCPKCTPRETK